MVEMVSSLRARQNNKSLVHPQPKPRPERLGRIEEAEAMSPGSVQGGRIHDPRLRVEYFRTKGQHSRRQE